jgi:hypothetical protein
LTKGILPNEIPENDIFPNGTLSNCNKSNFV